MPVLYRTLILNDIKKILYFILLYQEVTFYSIVFPYLLQSLFSSKRFINILLFIIGSSEHISIVSSSPLACIY